MHIINICFEYFLKSDTINYYDEIIDRSTFYNIHQEITLLSKNWYLDFNDNFIYKDISIPEVMSYELFNTKINLILAVMMILTVKKLKADILNIYVSKNFTVETLYFELLNEMGVKYHLYEVDSELIQELLPATESIHESSIKKFIRNAITFFNNKFKQTSNVGICYFQGYSTTLKLIEYFDNTIAVDQIPRRISEIVSKKKPLYFLPKSSNKYKRNIPLNIKSDENFHEIVKSVFYNHYLNNKDEVKQMIDTVSSTFKKLGISKAILMTPNSRMSSIIKQYIKQKNGTTFLYNHGVISYTHQKIDLDNIDTILCWNDYEYLLYRSLGKNVYKVGYPHFFELEKVKTKNKVEKETKISDSVISILTLSTSESYDITRQQIIDMHIDLVKMLLDLGAKKENIRLVIHPGRANKEFYIEAYKDFLLQENIKKNIPIVDIINQSDIVIGGASTVIYEATFLNTPYYTYEPNAYNLLQTQTIFHEKYINAANSLSDLKQNLLYNNAQNIEEFKKCALYNKNFFEVSDMIKKIVKEVK